MLSMMLTIQNLRDGAGTEALIGLAPFVLILAVGVVASMIARMF